MFKRLFHRQIEPKVELIDSTPEIISETILKPLVDLDKDFNASSERLTELRMDRFLGDIPLDDEYWKALDKHNRVYGINDAD